MITLAIVVGYLVVGTVWACVLQTYRISVIPPTSRWGRDDPWLNWELGAACLSWPWSVACWTVFLTLRAIFTGVGWIVRRVCWSSR